MKRESRHSRGHLTDDEVAGVDAVLLGGTRIADDSVLCRATPIDIRVGINDRSGNEKALNRVATQWWYGDVTATASRRGHIDLFFRGESLTPRTDNADRAPLVIHHDNAYLAALAWALVVKDHPYGKRYLKSYAQYVSPILNKEPDTGLGDFWKKQDCDAPTWSDLGHHLLKEHRRYLWIDNPTSYARKSMGNLHKKRFLEEKRRRCPFGQEDQADAASLSFDRSQFDWRIRRARDETTALGSTSMTEEVVEDVAGQIRKEKGDDVCEVYLCRVCGVLPKDQPDYLTRRTGELWDDKRVDRARKKIPSEILAATKIKKSPLQVVIDPSWMRGSSSPYLVVDRVTIKPSSDRDPARRSLVYGFRLP